MFKRANGDKTEAVARRSTELLQPPARVETRRPSDQGELAAAASRLAAASRPVLARVNTKPVAVPSVMAARAVQLRVEPAMPLTPLSAAAAASAAARLVESPPVHARVLSPMSVLHLSIPRQPRPMSVLPTGSPREVSPVPLVGRTQDYFLLPTLASFHSNVSRLSVGSNLSYLNSDKEGTPMAELDAELFQPPHLPYAQAAPQQLVTLVSSIAPLPVQFKTTMRSGKRDKKAFNEDKPWKHHRDATALTEQEKKRYEGLWATNRGLYLGQVVVPLRDQSLLLHGALTAALRANNTVQEEVPHLMLGAVVALLWTRSRLPQETLRQVWLLVDRHGDGCLDKDEFVVGTWLVDQCLYGRKLPREVSSDVWGSVLRMNVNVVIKGKRR